MEALVQYLAALALAGTAGWLIATLGSASLEGAVSAFGQLVRGWRPDPWPRGVQEEDRDRPWGAACARDAPAQPVALDDHVQPVPARPVHPRTRPR